jgi:hypothetical protein
VVAVSNQPTQLKMVKIMNDFDKGVFYVAGLLVTFMDSPGYAVDVLEQAGLLNADISSLDETEQRAMKTLMKDGNKRVNLTGLTI